MKKYFLSIVALAGMLFATSCQESLVEPQMEGPTTFTVQLPNQMGTKADFGHANNVDKLLVEVYPAGQTSSSLFQTVAEVKEGKATVALNLIQGQLYDILFWAQKGNNYVQVTKDGNTYSFDNNLTSIPMNDNFLNNDNGAAFFHAEKNFEPSGTPTPITLYRPFAQLNLGTTDASLNTNAGKYTLVRSSISVSGMATTFNAYTGEGEGEQNVTYNFEEAAVPTQSLKVGENTYNYVSMNYLSVLGNEKDLLDEVVATIIVKNAAGIEMQPITHTFELVPVQENYRTNIVGNLISSTTDFKVLVDDDFAEEEYNYVAPGIELINGEYVIVSEEGLWSLAEHVNSGTKAINTFAGKTFKLGVDIDLKNQEWTPIGSGFAFDGTFDGDGHTIKNLNVNVSKFAGLFGDVHGTIKNVKVQGAKISSHHYAGTIVGYIYGNVMNCEVSDAIITSTVEEVNGVYDNGDKTGGIVCYVGENGNYQITGNKVNNVVITGYRDMGGIVGYLQKNILTSNEISDLTLVVDMTHNYKNYPQHTNVGPYYGYAGAGSTIDNATVEAGNNYTISVIEEYVDVQAELNSNVATEGATVILTSGDYTFPSNVAEGVTIICQEGTVFEGNSNLNIKGSTVIGAEFRNESGSIVNSGSINGQFKNCTFEGKQVFRMAYAGSESVFEDCYFKESGDEWLFHFDGAGVSNAKIICRRCTFDGKRVAIAGTISSLVMEDCKFINGDYFNIYCNAQISDTQFEINRVSPLANHTTFTNCTYKGERMKFQHLGLFSGYDCKVTIDDVDYASVSTPANLEKYANGATRDINIYFRSTLYGADVTIQQKKDVDIYINGNGNAFTGRTLYIHGGPQGNSDETLTLDNIHFSSFSTRDLISSNSAEVIKRYAHNITIQNCFFEGDAGIDVVALRLRQSYNVTIKDCESRNLHSLGQITSIDGLCIDNVKINGLSGINLLNGGDKVYIKNTIVNATESDAYGIRVDALYPQSMVIEGCEINAYEPIVFRKSTSDYKCDFIGENFLNATGSHQIVVKDGTQPTMSGHESFSIKLP